MMAYETKEVEGYVSYRAELPKKKFELPSEDSCVLVTPSGRFYVKAHDKYYDMSELFEKMGIGVLDGKSVLEIENKKE
jgi:hypothetical protein